MGKITKIEHNPAKQRYFIYVDERYCTSIRARTFPAMLLAVGQTITCEELKEREKFFWKQAYGQAAWKKEGVRLHKVKALIEAMDARIVANIVGFGAGSTELIPEHPKEAGAPDIEVRTTDLARSVIVLVVEVTGTEQMRGATYWVRPDKLAYAKAHVEQDVWLILHYAEPPERFVFIKPSATTQYPVAVKTIRGADEHYVEFIDASPEVVTQQAFTQHLIHAIETTR